MINYFKSECYRILRNKGTYLFIVICSFLLVCSNIVLAAVKHAESNFPYATTRFSFSNVYTSMTMVYLLCIMVSNMIFGNEHTNHTMKNSISYGISRGTIYFGKLLVQILYSVAAFTIIIGAHIISAYLLLENSGINELNFLLRTCTASFPMFLFGLALTNCFMFNIEGTGAISAASGIMIAFPLVCNLLGMKFIAFRNIGKILPWNILASMKLDEASGTFLSYWSSSTGYQNCWILGLIQMVIVAVLGYLAFAKREVK